MTLHREDFWTSHGDAAFHEAVRRFVVEAPMPPEPDGDVTAILDVLRPTYPDVAARWEHGRDGRVTLHIHRDGLP